MNNWYVTSNIDLSKHNANTAYWIANWDDSKIFLQTDLYKPKRIAFNGKYTIVFWKDGTKTVVKCADDEKFIEEVGVAEAIAEKVFGSRSQFLKAVQNAHRQDENVLSKLEKEVSKVEKELELKQKELKKVEEKLSTRKSKLNKLQNEK